jgi:adenine-specific DNA glycosylase
MSPCSLCEKTNRTCLVSEGSSRCSECVRRGQKYDVEGIPAGDWLSLEREEERLNAEEAKATATMIKTLARLARLQKQKRLLRSRARDMLRRGLKTLDELDEAEEKERLEAEAQAQLDVAMRNPTSDLFSDLGLDPDDPFWATLGFVGEMP